MAKFENIDIKSNDDGTFTVTYRAKEKKSKKGEPCAYEPGKTMTAQNESELIKKIKSLVGGNDLKRFFEE